MPIIILASLGPLGAALSGISDTLATLIELTPGAAMAELVRVGWFGLDGADADGVDAQLRRDLGRRPPSRCS